jgi:protocatechuate 3,4-dioxygenase beta subunit
MVPPPSIDRRVALTTLGTVSLGAVLAACGSSSPESSTSTNAPTTSTAGQSTSSTTTGGATTSIFDAAASCTLSPEQTEGPYYFDVDMIRGDIRDDREGTTLRLALRVLDAATCSPLPDAVVDIWHCDALGVYSGFDEGEGATFLRGAQVTNTDGVAELVTIYPGWYRGRTIHIHVKVHLDNSTVLTSQLYFPEDVTAQVYSRQPYASDPGRDTSNAEDNIFDERMVMTLTEDGDGYLAAMNVNVEA